LNGFATREIDPAAVALGNAAAELRLITELVADNRRIDAAADQCQPADFADQFLGRVFGVLVEQRALGNAMDGVTLAPFFREDQEWTDRRFSSELAAAHMNAVGGREAETYAAQILGLAQRRRLVGGMRRVITSAHDLDVPHDMILAEADDAVAEISNVGSSVEQAPAGTYAANVIASFGQAVRGVQCGIIAGLDDLTGPLRPGSLNLLGGRPGMAKTATASSYALGAAIRGHGVLFVSLEMTADELARRMLADLCHSVDSQWVPYEFIRDGRVTPDQLALVRAAQQRLDRLPLEITDPSRLTLAQLRRRVRRDKRRRAVQSGRLELVVVDYLQLVAPSQPGMKPYDHITEVSKGLKELAKAEGVAVLALAQLSREVEKRPDRRPIQSDLRDSGQIEQDADMILFLYREEEYLRRDEPQDQTSSEWLDWRDDMDAVKGRIEFIMPKRRTVELAENLAGRTVAAQAVRGTEPSRSGGDRNG
jgi:replicative DNA helicase